MADHLYLSPHLDDAVYSCGGLIFRQASQGDSVTVLTVCAGDPPKHALSAFAKELHARWGDSNNPIAARRAEDHEACGVLGADVHHLDTPDAIYRVGANGVPLYADVAAITGPLHEAEIDLIEHLTEQVAGIVPDEARLYCPLGIGGHVDHRLTRLAAERIVGTLWYYQDFPYAGRKDEIPEDLWIPLGVETTYRLNKAELAAWQDASARYRSQISTFWKDRDELYGELRDFHDRLGGIKIIETAF